MQTEHTPFALRQHVRADVAKALGDPDQAWTWEPKGDLKPDSLAEYAMSGKHTRYNSGGVADSGENV